MAYVAIQVIANVITATGQCPRTLRGRHAVMGTCAQGYRRGGSGRAQDRHGPDTAQHLDDKVPECRGDVALTATGEPVLRKPIAREILLQEVWGYNSQVTTHTLETHIYRLRQKIEPDPGNARLLVTDAGGYRLNP